MKNNENIRYLTAGFFSAILAYLLYLFNGHIAFDLLPANNLLYFAYDWITITIVVGIAVALSDKLTGDPNPWYMGFLMIPFTVFILGLYYLLVFAFPQALANVYADVALSVLITWIFITIDNN